MPAISPLRLALAAGATLVSAHGHIQEILINGESFEGWNPGAKTPADGIAWQTSATDNGFVGPEAFGTSDIACHRDGKAATSSAKVAAGDKIELKWDTWPESHKGPVLDYLAACDGDCSSADPGSLNFFKIDEAGLVDGSSAPGTYASDDLIAAGNSWTVTIPSSLKAGNYVLRHEIIALHSAGQENGAQNYPQCVNIEVTGSGSDLPEGVPATSLYKADDAGIKFNIYEPLDSYPIPGPKVAVAGGGAGSGSGGGAAPAPTSAAPTSAAASSAPAPTTLVTKTSAAAADPAPTQGGNNGGGNSQAAALYAQCGGQGFTGPTSCAEGTCKEQNSYYSQCVPN